MTLKRLIATWAAALALPVCAQDQFPSKPINIIVPIAQATTADIIARAVADKLSQRLGQPVLVQNRPGAGGTIGAAFVAGSPPDGYTLMSINSAHSINPALYANLPFDTLRDFAGIALVADSPALVIVHPGVGARTIAELVQIAKQKPGAMNYGSAGVGSATHLAGALFVAKAGVDIVHVPYKGGSDLITDIVSGRLQMTFVPPAFLLSQIKDGRVLALGVGMKEPMREPLEIPSVRSGGVDYEYSTWYGFLAPAKVPQPVLERLAAAILQTLDDKDLLDRFRAQGLIPRRITLRDFDGYIRADMDKLAPVIKASGARAN